MLLLGSKTASIATVKVQNKQRPALNNNKQVKINSKITSQLPGKPKTITSSSKDTEEKPR